MLAAEMKEGLTMGKRRGAIAAGHEKTAEAAKQILQEGGNAFDAALAAMLAACVAEPVLASLGGGGFLLAHRGDGQATLYDFFAQTPLHRSPPSNIDFHPIMADFGTAQQEFHIGLGSMATPGMVRGIFTIHRDLCRLPLEVIIAPACKAAREGVLLNSFQHYISTIVAPIINASTAAQQLHANADSPHGPAEIGQRTTNPELADALEALAAEGEDLFYRGDIGQRLVRDCREQGGYLQADDLEQYRVMPRKPLRLRYHDAQLLTNPPPSIGGTLTAFTLSLLEPEQLGHLLLGGEEHLRKMARAMWLTQQLRIEHKIDRELNEAGMRKILSNPFLSAYRRTLRQHSPFSRGTTHISVIDADDNLASMTLSNGEGAGHVLPGTGIMMNNMLGEEDINPHGFNQWPEGRRIASMMAPTLIFAGDGRAVATGSGGSNRIRSAILQVLINLLDFDLGIEEAVEHPRIHFESGLLNLEAGPSDQILAALLEEFPQQKTWPEKNLFFGGAHSVIRNHQGQLHGKGDSRRGGHFLQA
jgi:gamma-glutamyltranspeptidase/glutathione hydrolase